MNYRKFIITGELPGLNEIIQESKTNKFKYAYSKSNYTQICAYEALKCLSFDSESKVDLIITWYTKNLKKDPDNVSAGIKYILDGIVSANLIKNDTRKYINSIKHIFDLDKNNPRIIVELIQV